ncbi:MAG: di-trans,poly-cis-decaprenylcistransferase [Verrucomicrobia bacterium]|nr:di-trans,poly-cis-decaprenylcistransferase [Verrucomicrobiota bacterium]
MIVPSLAEAESKQIFTPNELALLKVDKIPKHIAIIMDGNRRWAKMRGLSPAKGHWEGAEVLTEIVRAASEIGIKTVTVYAFSTENWRRSDGEIEGLMNLFQLYLLKKREMMIREGICLSAIGNLDKLPKKVLDTYRETHKATQHCHKINLVLAMNYGSRDEIRRAVVKILSEHEKTKFDPESLTEQAISQYLDTSPWGDPDLLIRTSGELRVSNFLLWQISYAEIYITDVMWPEFSPKELLEAVLAYQGRNRRLGVQ